MSYATTASEFFLFASTTEASGRFDIWMDLLARKTTDEIAEDYVVERLGIPRSDIRSMERNIEAFLWNVKLWNHRRLRVTKEDVYDWATTKRAMRVAPHMKSSGTICLR